jgi:hypothetical protein
MLMCIIQHFLSIIIYLNYQTQIRILWEINVEVEKIKGKKGYVETQDMTL